MSHSQFQSRRFILRHAWLNLWDERMTTGRIDQVTMLLFSEWLIHTTDKHFTVVVPSISHPKNTFVVSLNLFLNKRLYDNTRGFRRNTTLLCQNGKRTTLIITWKVKLLHICFSFTHSNKPRITHDKTYHLRRHEPSRVYVSPCHPFHTVVLLAFATTLYIIIVRRSFTLRHSCATCCFSILPHNAYQ